MNDSGYSYAAEPRAVQGRRKYRDPYDEMGSVPPANIMFDRRVVRGNTYAAQVVPVNEQESGGSIQQSRSRQNRSYEEELGQRPLTPDPVDGRKHMDVQTENYLEELTDRLPEVDEETQTEAFMDRPPSPKFIPTRIGIDKATTIEPGDLFDFDMEVEPILEVLVGKTLEQSMLEVLEDEELRNIRRHQEEFEQTRNAELAEVQRLEAEAKRRWEEKERRLQQERERVEREKAVREKVAARAFARDYLTDLHSNLFDNLTETGHFSDPLKNEVQSQFLPWVLDVVAANLDGASSSRALTDALLLSALQRGVQKAELARSQREQAAADQVEAPVEEKKEEVGSGEDESGSEYESD